MNLGRKGIVRVALAAAVVAVATVAGTGIASADDGKLHRVDGFHCGLDSNVWFGKKEFFTFNHFDSNSGMTVPDCLADAGNVQFEGGGESASSWTSGNNAGYFSFLCPGDDFLRLMYFDKHQGGRLDGGARFNCTVATLTIK
jgi:hypothetical protein